MSDQDLAEPEKDPSNSEDGAQPLTESQRSEIESLGGEDSSPDRELTRAEAAQLIDQLRHRTGGETG
jgi:hypothetical protein